MTELQKRVGVSVIFIPLLLVALWLGGIPLLAMFAVVNLGGMMEYVTMMRQKGLMLSWLWISLGFVAYVAFVFWRGLELPMIWILMAGMIVEALFSWHEETSVPRLFATGYGLLYTALLPALIVRIGLDYIGQPILLSLIIMIWIVDSVAYFIGMSFGKHRNVTRVSPRKSVEGFLAGVLVPFIVVFILYVSRWEVVDYRIMLMIAFAAGFFGQLGDLAESMLKRYCGVKDSSRLIPGHGGILDRTDSILLAGSFLYCILSFLQKVR